MRRVWLAITLASVFSGTALAGEMPGVGASATGQVPTVSSATPKVPSPIVGEVPTMGSATLNATESSLVTTVLVKIIALIGR